MERVQGKGGWTRRQRSARRGRRTAPNVETDEGESHVRGWLPHTMDVEIPQCGTRPPQGVRLIRGRCPGGRPRGSCSGAGRRAAVLQISRGWIRRDGMDGSGAGIGGVSVSGIATWPSSSWHLTTGMCLCPARSGDGSWLSTLSYECNDDKHTHTELPPLAHMSHLPRHLP